MPNNPNKPTPVDETPFVVPAFALSDKQDFPLQVSVSGKAKAIDLPDDRFIFLSPGQEVTLTNLNDPSKTSDAEYDRLVPSDHP